MLQFLRAIIIVLLNLMGFGIICDGFLYLGSGGRASIGTLIVVVGLGIVYIMWPLVSTIGKK